jgi:small-conductance mechanosensitive channel
MGLIDDARDGLHDLAPWISTAVSVVLVLLAAVLAERIVVRLLRRAYWRRVERAEAARGVEELSRVKRQKTLVTLLESLVRYGVYGAAIVVVLGLLTDGRATAVFGASIVVLVGFGLQRLLGDVVAGALLLFEGHFAVGDVVTVHQHNITGIVEEFSLRTTALRTLGGDRITIMNGAMVSFTRWSYGQREFRLELIARGADAIELALRACEVESAAADSLWVRPPAIHSSEPLGDAAPDLVRIVATVVVAPGQEQLVDRLAALLEAHLGSDRLIGPVTSLPLYAPSFGEWRASLLLRG